MNFGYVEIILKYKLSCLVISINLACGQLSRLGITTSLLLFLVLIEVTWLKLRTLFDYSRCWRQIEVLYMLGNCDGFWGGVMECFNCDAFEYRIQHFEVAYLLWHVFVEYVKNVHAISHKENFINESMSNLVHLGNATSNMYIFCFCYG